MGNRLEFVYNVMLAGRNGNRSGRSSFPRAWACVCVCVCVQRTYACICRRQSHSGLERKDVFNDGAGTNADGSQVVEATATWESQTTNLFYYPPNDDTYGWCACKYRRRWRRYNNNYFAGNSFRDRLRCRSGATRSFGPTRRLGTFVHSNFSTKLHLSSRICVSRKSYSYCVAIAMISLSRTKQNKKISSPDGTLSI